VVVVVVVVVVDVVVVVVVEVVVLGSVVVVLPCNFRLLQPRWFELCFSHLTCSQNLGRLLVGFWVAKFLNFSVSRFGLFEDPPNL